VIAVGEKVMCRFRWFEAPIEGCAVFTPQGSDRLDGGWWFLQDIPVGLRTDLAQLHDLLPAMNPLTLRRVELPKSLPPWASQYFTDAAKGSI
jgi:hypothetical protein